MRVSLITMMLLVWLMSHGAASGAQGVPPVVVNEIAWAGTTASGNDEWIELYNNTDDAIDLSGWTLRWADRVIRFDSTEDSNASEIVNTIILARGFYLLERTDDNTIVNVNADLIYTGALRNGGEVLELFDPQDALIDTANLAADTGWLAGSGASGDSPFSSMERINPANPDVADNWASNNGDSRNGIDAADNPINGTPNARNSVR